MKNIVSITKNGKKLSARLSESLPALFELEFDLLINVEIKVTSVGSENLYFTFVDDCGNERQGFCKCL